MYTLLYFVLLNFYELVERHVISYKSSRSKRFVLKSSLTLVYQYKKTFRDILLLLFKTEEILTYK